MNQYAHLLSSEFDKQGIAHAIDENVDEIKVEFPADSLTKLQPGQFFAWYNEQNAWAICNSAGVIEWITPLKTPKAETATADGPAPAQQKTRWHITWPKIEKKTQYALVAIMLGITLIFGLFSTRIPDVGAVNQQLPDPTATLPLITTTPELSLLSKAEQACGPGAKVIDIQLVNGEYTLVGSLQEIYPNETGPTVWYVAGEGMPIGPFAWLFRGKDATAEFRKAMELDSSRISTVKKCEGEDCSTLWQTAYGLVNSFKNDRLYGDGKNPAYLKNVVEAMFWSLRGWVNSATLDINAGRDWNRCIQLQPVADMMEISQEDKDFLKSQGGKADPGNLPPSGASKAPIIATATPLIITATPGMAVGFGQAAYDKYNQIVGVESANTAFTANDASQCYSTMTASWADFKTESPLNEILRILGPNGFKIEENSGAYMARSFDKDGSGRSACITITGIETNYPEGVWHISGVGKVSTLHWTESYPNNAEEILTGTAWIYPLWKNYTEPLPTSTPAPNAPPVIYIGELGNWMSGKGMSELTAACPPEPLSGYVYLNQVTIDFQNDGLSGMRYSKSSCEEYGKLSFSTYDPGRGDLQVKLGQNLWTWPMNKPIAIMPTEVGAPVFPADGASMNLDQMLGYAQQAGITQVSVSCTNYTNGSIPGWPNAVPVQVINRSTTWYVDFGVVANNVSTNDLCHTYNIPGTGTSFNGRPLRLQSWQPTDQWTIDNQGPWWNHGSWWLSPFK